MNWLYAVLQVILAIFSVACVVGWAVYVLATLNSILGELQDIREELKGKKE